MLKVAVENNAVRIGKRFSVSFQRTLRIPDDGRTYPLPPGLGRFPVSRVEDFARRVPTEWRKRGGVFIPMYQREALWLAFDGTPWKPNAVKIGVGKVNAISGDQWDEKLRVNPQDYIICPDQPWLDGINTGDGFVRQFVAMPLGLDYTVEAQITGKEEFGGIQILVFEPKSGRFPDRPPKRQPYIGIEGAPLARPGGGMGLGAGGKMRQKIYPDPYGLDTWDVKNRGFVFVHIVNSEQYQNLTGHPPPPTPINAKTYTEHGLPWFDLYDEFQGNVAPSKKLAKVKSIKEQDVKKKRPPRSEEEPIHIAKSQIKKLRHPTAKKK